GEHQEGAKIPRRRRVDERTPQPEPQARVEADRALEVPATVADQVETGIAPPLIPLTDLARRPCPGACRLSQRLPGDIELGSLRSAREGFDGMPIAVPTDEVHRREIAVGAERPAIQA